MKICCWDLRWKHSQIGPHLVKLLLRGSGGLFLTYHGRWSNFSATLYSSKYQLSPTNPRDALHHGKRVADTLSVINLQPNYDNAFDARSTFSSYSELILSKVADFNLPHLHLAPQLGVMTPFEFCRDHRHHNTHGLSCGVVCVILRPDTPKGLIRLAV